MLALLDLAVGMTVDDIIIDTTPILTYKDEILLRDIKSGNGVEDLDTTYLGLLLCPSQRGTNKIPRISQYFLRLQNSAGLPYDSPSPHLSAVSFPLPDPNPLILSHRLGKSGDLIRYLDQNAGSTQCLQQQPPPCLWQPWSEK